MFAWWGRAVVRLRWGVLGATLALVLVGLAWGTGVFGALSNGGFDDPGSESSRAITRISERLGPQGTDIIVLYSSPTATVDDPALRGPVQSVLRRLDGRTDVAQVQSYYTTSSPALVSTDRHATYLAIRLAAGSVETKREQFDDVRDLLVADGVQTEIGGTVPFFDEATKQVERDIVRAELISLPIVLVLMLFIFRGLIAATMPLLVGGVAILGAFTVTRLLAGFTDVSVFAANVITMLGLGMAIDYALFVVSRFREELAAGRTPAQAVATTMVTAGRTVLVSGLTVALALSSLLLFPLGFLRSMGYGGMAAVGVAMIAALTVLPAVLFLLGHRINAVRIPVPSWGSSQDGNGWARLARVVMRRPVFFAVGISVLLLVVATPFLRSSYGGFDERVLPVGSASRTVSERLDAEFPGGNVAPIVAVLTDVTPAAAQSYADAVGRVPGVTGAAVTAARDDAALVTVTYHGIASSEEARGIVSALRQVTPPPGSEVLVTGRPATDLDQLDSLASRLPWMVGYVAVVTFLLLFLAFGSVVLPLKAIVMNAISIGASYGVVVWIFQDGHLANLFGFTASGYLEPSNLVLMLAILFGLSTDYEVFLLSRIREEWDRRGDNTEAVTVGLQRTGGIITAAALLLIIVIGGFATGGTTSIKMLGVGTVVAVAVDAALVRTLLVPATMRLLGRWNWWAPAPLARLYRRYGIRESAAAEPTPELAGATR